MEGKDMRVIKRVICWGGQTFIEHTPDIFTADDGGYLEIYMGFVVAGGTAEVLEDYFVIEEMEHDTFDAEVS